MKILEVAFYQLSNLSAFALHNKNIQFNTISFYSDGVTNLLQSEVFF